jgi:hypothetical protein
MRVINEIVSQNMDKERLDAFLAAKVSSRDETKKAISMWWKQEQTNILAAIRGPTADDNEGIADIDWQIHLTTATRHSSKVN